MIPGTKEPKEDTRATKEAGALTDKEAGAKGQEVTRDTREEVKEAMEDQKDIREEVKEDTKDGIRQEVTRGRKVEVKDSSLMLRGLALSAEVKGTSPKTAEEARTR